MELPRLTGRFINFQQGITLGPLSTLYLNKIVSTKPGAIQSVMAAHAAKSLTPNINTSFSSGWIPPRVLNFVVAYTGPAQMNTVHSWILNSHSDLNIPLPIWDQKSRFSVPGTALDGLFLLQKGFIKLDNSPMTLNTQQTPVSGTHVICDSSSGNLLMLFLALQEACNNLQGAWLNAIPYLQSVQFQNVRIV